MFEHAFHGRTLLTMSMTSKVAALQVRLRAVRARGLPPALPLRVPQRTYAGTAPPPAGGRSRSSSARRCAADKVACVVIELVLGEGGFIVAPPAWRRAARRDLPRARDPARRSTRSRPASAAPAGCSPCEHYGLEPDLVTMAKSLGGGLPISAVTGRAELMDAAQVGGLGGTYAGNPVACAAALAAIEFIEREPAARARGGDRRARRGARSAASRDRFPLRRRRPRPRRHARARAREGSRRRRSPTRSAPTASSGRAYERGLLLVGAGTYGNVIRTLMPLVVTDAELDGRPGCARECARQSAYARRFCVRSPTPSALGGSARPHRQTRSATQSDIGDAHEHAGAASRNPQRWLDIISAPELTRTSRRRRSRPDTVDNFNFYYNRGYLEYRKSVDRDAGRPGARVGRRGLDVPGPLGPHATSTASAATASTAPASGTRRSSGRSPTSSQRMPLSSQELLDPLRGALAELLGEITPGDLQYSFFINNGTDAVEGAIKLARVYTGKTNFISSLRGFHGKSCGSLSLLGKWEYREPFLPLLPGIHFVEFGDAEAVEDELYKADADRQGHRRGDHGADPGRGRRDRAARRLLAAHPEGLRRVRHAPHRRRGADRPRAHRQALRRRPLERRARHHVPRQGPRRRRHAALGVHLDAEDLGRARRRTRSSTPRPSAATRWPAPPESPRST